MGDTYDMRFRKFWLVFLLLGLCLSCRTFAGLLDKSGTIFVIEVKPDQPTNGQVTDAAVEILTGRLDALGVSGNVTKISANRIEVKIYGKPELERMRKFLTAESKFEIDSVVSLPNPAPVKTYPTQEAALSDPEIKLQAPRFLPYKRNVNYANEWVAVATPPIVDGSEVENASANSNTGKDGDYVISFSLKKAGAQKFGDWTGRNINNYLAVVLNGEVKSVGFVKSQIFDSGEITGTFTKQEAEDMALLMRSGYLPATLTLIEEKAFDK
jgi:preprotein translocase subunit SecD